MRTRSIYLAISYLLIFCLPLFSLALGRQHGDLWQILFYGAISWLGLWAVFQRPRWFHYALLPAFLAIPIDTYLRLYYDQGISTHHIGIIAETSPKEALEFLGYKIWLLILFFILILMWWWSLLRSAQKDILVWRHKSRWFVLILLVIACGIFAYGYKYGVTKPTSASNSASKIQESNPWLILSPQEAKAFLNNPPQLPESANILFDENKFGQSWPLGIYTHVVHYFLERRYLSQLSEKNKNFFFHAKQDADSDLPQTIIVVIGESSRYDRWSINGYQRETNPLLKQENHLVSLSNMITPVSATRLSVPIITTRKDALQSLKPGFSEKSFLSAFKEAGFKTYWISNQMSFGEFDTPTSVIANEADEVHFLNLGGFTNASNFDEVLLTATQKVMQESAPKKLIVLHTLGNHWNYSHRYPVEYDQWKPSLFGIEKPAYTNLKNKEALSNSYDNSILYTDYILSQVIAQLKQSDTVNAMMYISDHGQTLFDGNCKYAFHGHNTQFEFHIPAFVWYSQQYQQHFPDKVSTLIAHKNAELSTENVFHSLLDMVNIHTPDEQLSRSIFSTQWKAHTRYVDSYGWSNYDDSTLKGDCREVIDNKKPLVQEK